MGEENNCALKGRDKKLRYRTRIGNNWSIGPESKGWKNKPQKDQALTTPMTAQSRILRTEKKKSIKVSLSALKDMRSWIQVQITSRTWSKSSEDHSTVRPGPKRAEGHTMISSRRSEADLTTATLETKKNTAVKLSKYWEKEINPGLARWLSR